jgi:hypothetical protein
MDRVEFFIDSEFENFKRKYDLSMEINNSLNELRYRLYELKSKIIGELKVNKKYNKNIDLIFSDLSRVNIEKQENPYWLEGEIVCERPPGPTNREVNKLIDTINEIMKKCFYCNDHISDTINSKIVEEVRRTFAIPNENIPFTKGLYDRTPIIRGLKQNIPCAICGESRVIDICHIIPAELRGPKDEYNTIYLCPTHHRLFDRLMLTEDEWNKIDWSKKGKASTNYVYYVLKPEIEKFWRSLDKNIYEKQSGNLVYFGISSKEKLTELYQETIIEIINIRKVITLKELVEESKIAKGKCMKGLKELLDRKKIRKKVVKNRNYYSIAITKNK